MNWFSDLTGLASDAPDAVRRGIAVDGDWLVSTGNGQRMRAGNLTTPSLAELREAAPHSGRSRLRLQIADVRELHKSAQNEGAAFQVASQFNLLEMVSPAVTPDDGVACYEWDPTQGPACAISCGAGTIFRNYFAPVGGSTGQTARHQIDTAADLGRALGDGTPPWEMKNGYLLPDKEQLSGIARRIGGLPPEAREDLKALLRIGVQADTEVTLPGCGHCVTQLYCSAVPVAYGRHDADAWEPLARLVLEAAYEATFRAARLHAPGRPLYLTLLGGGAFGNRTGWIAEAIGIALARCEADAVLVSRGAPPTELQPLLSE